MHLLSKGRRMDVSPATTSSRSSASPTSVFGVFGIYRYILATMVMTAHSAPLIWLFVGTYAVRAFFVLSGYVVCYILHNDYLRQEKGVWKYAINRALRIYPTYWL